MLQTEVTICNRPPAPAQPMMKAPEYGNQSNEADNRVNEDETYILDFTGQQGGDNERHQGTCGIVGLHDGRVRPACIFFCEVLRAV